MMAVLKEALSSTSENIGAKNQAQTLTLRVTGI